MRSVYDYHDKTCSDLNATFPQRGHEISVTVKDHSLTTAGIFFIIRIPYCACIILPVDFMPASYIYVAP